MEESRELPMLWVFEEGEEGLRSGLRSVAWGGGATYVPSTTSQWSMVGRCSAVADLWRERGASSEGGKGIELDSPETGPSYNASPTIFLFPRVSRKQRHQPP